MMHLDPSKPIEGVLPFSGLLPESKGKLTSDIKKKILSLLKPLDLYSMMQTCSEMRKIITKIEPLNYCITAGKLLKNSYSMGINIAHNFINFKREKSEWLSNIAVALFPFDREMGLLAAQKSLEIASTHPEHLFPEILLKTRANIACKLINCYPDLSKNAMELALKSTINTVANLVTVKTKSEVFMKVPLVAQICENKELQTKVDSFEKSLYEAPNKLWKAECLLLLAIGYAQVNNPLQQLLVRRGVEIILGLTADQQYESIEEFAESESCINLLFMIDKTQAIKVFNYFQKLVMENNQVEVDRKVRVCVSLCDILFKQNMITECKDLAAEIEYLIENTNEDELLSQDRVFIDIATIHFAFNPIKSISYLNKIKTCSADRVGHMRAYAFKKRKSEVFLKIAENLPNTSPIEFVACIDSVINLLKSECLDKDDSMKIKSQCLISFDEIAMQSLLDRQNELQQASRVFSEHEYFKLDALSPDMQSQTLSQMALNRAKYNLEKRAMAVQANTRSISNIDLSFFEFKHIQAILDKMNTGFVKAKVMAEIAILMLQHP